MNDNKTEMVNKHEQMERDYQQMIQPIMSLIQQQTKDFKEYKESDFAWKARAEPVIMFYQNLTFTNRVVIAFLKFIVLLGTAIAAVYAGIKYLK